MQRRNHPRGSPGRHDLHRPVVEVKPPAPTRTPFQQMLLQHYPSSILLAVQLLLLVLYAFIDGFPRLEYLSSAATVVILLVVMLAISRPGWTRWAAWILAVPVIILDITAAFLYNANVLGLGVWAALLEGILYLYAAGLMIAYMLEDERVTLDELFAAGSTFTLIAWMFAWFYVVIQAWTPGTFSGSTSGQDSFTFLKLLSYSFSNLTGTGLSGILPSANSARVLTMLEQFLGVGFIAMVVSRLVGLTLRPRRPS